MKNIEIGQKYKTKKPRIKFKNIEELRDLFEKTSFSFKWNDIVSF